MLLQLIEQCLGILQIGRIKALGEPRVDWCQEVIGFLAFPLLLPEVARLVAARSSRIWLVGFGLSQGLDGSRFLLQPDCLKTVVAGVRL